MLAGVVTISASRPLASSALRTRACRAASRLVVCPSRLTAGRSVVASGKSWSEAGCRWYSFSLYGPLDPGRPGGTFVGNDGQPRLELGDHRIDRFVAGSCSFVVGATLVLVGKSCGDLRRPRAPTVLDIGELTNRGDVVRRRLEHVIELAGRFVVPAHFEQGAAECDPG